MNALVCLGDVVITYARSRAALALLNSETVIRVDQNTEFHVRAPKQEDRSFLDLLSGAIHFLSRVPRMLEVDTPFCNAAVEGTEFSIRVDDVQTFISVFEGRVVATNEFGSLTVASNEAAAVLKDTAPKKRIVARPRDAVQWALYYQPILAPLLAPTTPEAEEALALGLRRAIDAFRGGDLPAAFSAFDEVAAPERDETYHLYRAAALLAVGRVDEARPHIDEALNLAPGNGEALGLRAVIAVAQNAKEQALTDARKAVELAPRSVAAQLALSYALQATFDLPLARDAARRAVDTNPGDALAWARLADLSLALGERDDALGAAETAAGLAPGLSRANTVLGFARLAQIKIADATSAFEAAVERDSEDPLPRLGLGLAKIRVGNLVEGRRDIEIASALDPNNSLVRSYLGKAYFEEKRAPLDANQFAIAKELDPADPTPWFYDALREQSENRPVAAMNDLQTSTRLNDNRAVYRSRLLLDQDRAVRGASLARIYSTLGFDQLAVNEGARSLAVDPANHSAHRFLADTYATRPRHEIARASELLQAQLLQPINITPVQPQASEIDLNVLARAGPARPGLNEFTPLFQRDGVQFVGDAFVGNNETRGDEAVISVIYGRGVFSLGQYHFETEGFRENNDIEHNIYNIYAQAQLTDQLDVQFEYRHRETEQGDLRLDFDPDLFSGFDRREIKKKTPRLGVHYSPAPGHDFIASLLYTDREEDLKAIGTRTQSPIIEAASDTDGYDAQAQYLYNSDLFNLTIGGGAVGLNERFTQTVNLTPVLPAFVCAFLVQCVTTTIDDLEADETSLYVYGGIDLPTGVTWTLGVSYNDQDTGNVEVERFNPKLGVRWQVTDLIGLRLAYIKTVKRVLAVDQTLEPTQVAGFNQFFDDANGTRAERYGIGLDLSLAPNLYAGGEVSRRHLDVPIVGVTVITEDRREDLYRAYINWTPTDDWALSAEYRFERFKRNEARAAAALLPVRVDTVSVPVTARYFSDPSLIKGLFAEVGVTFVHQNVDFPSTVVVAKDSDSFFLVDVAVGYRLPRRLGIVSLEVRNLFDEKFFFQDLDFYNADTNNPPFIPDRTVMGRLAINF